MGSNTLVRYFYFLQPLSSSWQQDSYSFKVRHCGYQEACGCQETHPRLKVLRPLGGWGGCKTCSTVFASEQGRTEFAESVSDALEYFGADTPSTGFVEAIHDVLRN